MFDESLECPKWLSVIPPPWVYGVCAQQALRKTSHEGRMGWPRELGLGRAQEVAKRDAGLRNGVGCWPFSTTASSQCRHPGERAGRSLGVSCHGNYHALTGSGNTPTFTNDDLTNSAPTMCQVLD